MKVTGDRIVLVFQVSVKNSESKNTKKYKFRLSDIIQNDQNNFFPRIPDTENFEQKTQKNFKNSYI